jgi:hypothetical protein
MDVKTLIIDEIFDINNKNVNIFLPCNISDSSQDDAYYQLTRYYNKPSTITIIAKKPSVVKKT